MFNGISSRNADSRSTFYPQPKLGHSAHSNHNLHRPAGRGGSHKHSHDSVGVGKGGKSKKKKKKKRKKNDVETEDTEPKEQEEEEEEFDLTASQARSGGGSAVRGIAADDSSSEHSEDRAPLARQVRAGMSRSASGVVTVDPRVRPGRGQGRCSGRGLGSGRARGRGRGVRGRGREQKNSFASSPARVVAGADPEGGIGGYENGEVVEYQLAGRWERKKATVTRVHPGIQPIPTPPLSSEVSPMHQRVFHMIRL